MDEKELKEAYKGFWDAPFRHVIIKDLARYTEINKPVYRPGDKVEDAIYMSATQGVLHYILEMCHTSLLKEIQDNVGREE